ncbi:MAG TPA: hypothetical protein PK590_05035 [Candidatus Omnitrophota bacterium]|nr:hypothetical protein [Candidatus Omnitrophota bacterium]
MKSERWVIVFSLAIFFVGICGVKAETISSDYPDFKTVANYENMKTVEAKTGLFDMPFGISLAGVLKLAEARGMSILGPTSGSLSEEEKEKLRAGVDIKKESSLRDDTEFYFGNNWYKLESVLGSIGKCEFAAGEKKTYKILFSPSAEMKKMGVSIFIVFLFGDMPAEELKVYAEAALFQPDLFGKADGVGLILMDALQSKYGRPLVILNTKNFYLPLPISDDDLHGKKYLRDQYHKIWFSVNGPGSPLLPGGAEILLDEKVYTAMDESLFRLTQFERRGWTFACWARNITMVVVAHDRQEYYGLFYFDSDPNIAKTILSSQYSALARCAKDEKEEYAKTKQKAQGSL